jgi:hypothetical protein
VRIARQNWFASDPVNDAHPAQEVGGITEFEGNLRDARCDDSTTAAAEPHGNFTEQDIGLRHGGSGKEQDGAKRKNTVHLKPPG